MRITDSLVTSSLLNNIESGLSNYNTIQQQISTGKQLNTMSDDPTGGSQSLVLHADLVDNAQYQTNADSATAFLSASDSALSSATTVMNSANQIAVQGANGTENAEDLKSLSAQVDGLIKQLTDLGNSDLHGKYLFGGTQTQTPPFAAPATGADPTPTYVGDAGTVTATVGKNESLGLNVTGSATLGSAFSALQDLRKDLNSGDQTAISADIDKVTSSITTISSQRATLGSKTNEVADIKQRLTRAQGDYQDSISNIEDVDLAQAYVKLQSAQNVYQAALSTTAQSFKLSLTNYLN